MLSSKTLILQKYIIQINLCLIEVNLFVFTFMLHVYFTYAVA
jgi:hypothetical protein